MDEMRPRQRIRGSPEAAAEAIRGPQGERGVMISNERVRSRWSPEEQEEDARRLAAERDEEEDRDPDLRW